MRLSSEDVLEIIKQYSKTAKGAKEIQDHMKRKRQFVPQWADKSSGFHTFKQIKRAAEDMADILYKHIITDTVTPERDGLKNFKREDIIVHYPHSQGYSFAVNISINKDALHRDSLIETYDGIDDIIQLFVHGYSNAKASVHGVWHGTEIWTKRNRDGDPSFLINAVEEFNQKYNGKAVASLKSDYQVKKKQ